MTITQRIASVAMRILWILATSCGLTAYVYWLFYDYPGQVYPIIVGAVALIAWRVDTVTAAITLVVTAAMIDWFVLQGEGLAIAKPEQAAGLAVLLAVSAVMIWTMANLKHGRAKDAARISALEQAAASQAKQIETKREQLDELVHRVRNDLTTLGSIAALYGRNGDGAGGLRAMGDRITVLGQLYQRLHVTDRGDAEVEMKVFLEGLVGDLRDTHIAIRPISMTVDADTMVLPMKSAAVIGLTVNEAITNALKYAWPDQDTPGTLQVCLKRRGDTLRLTIVDDGVGPDGGKPKGTGMGSRLMRAMAAQVGGTFALQRDPDATVVSLEIPVTE